MGKKKVIYISTLLLLSLACVWYSLARSSSNENYLSALPSDIIALSRIHVDELVKVNDNAPSFFSSFFLQGFSNKTGIKHSAPLYVFMDKERRLGLVGALSNASTLESFLQKNHFNIERKDKFNRATWNYLHLAFDDEKLLAIMKPSSDADIESYMENSIMRTEQETSALQSAVDTLHGNFAIAAFANALPESVTSLMEMILPKESRLEDITITSSLSLHGKDICLEGKISSDKPEINKLMDRIDATFRPVGEYISLDSINSSIASVMHLNVQGKDFLQLARSIPEVRLALLALNMCIDADMMISSIDGTVTVFNVKESPANTNTVLNASLENTDFLRNINNWDDNLTSGSIGFEKLSDREFRIDALEKNFWFSVQDETLYLASPNPTNTFAGLVVSMPKGSATETQSRMVVQVKLEDFKEKMIPPMRDYLKDYNILHLHFKNSRHFNILIQ